MHINTLGGGGCLDYFPEAHTSTPTTIDQPKHNRHHNFFVTIRGIQLERMKMVPKIPL